LCQQQKGIKPKLSQPIELSSWTVNNQGETIPGKEQLRRLKLPSLPCDLNTGFDNFVPKDHSNAGDLSRVLSAIEKAEINTKGVSVISYRNNFNKILETPYRRQPWTIHIRRIDGVMRFHVVMEGDDFTDERSKRFSFYGYNFERFCTDESSEQVNPNVEYCSLVALKLDKFKIILAAEIDCYQQPDNNKKVKLESDSPTIGLSDYVELKTSRILDSPKAQYNWKRYNLLKMWIQSFLVGVPTIICGFRDNAGFVQSTKEIKTQSIPSLAKGIWDAYDCLNFACGLLDWLTTRIQEDKLYTLSFAQPFSSVCLFEQNKEK